MICYGGCPLCTILGPQCRWGVTVPGSQPLQARENLWEGQVEERMQKRTKPWPRNYSTLGPWLVFTRGGKLIKHYQAPSELVNQHLLVELYKPFFFFFSIVVNDLFHPWPWFIIFLMCCWVLFVNVLFRFITWIFIRKIDLSFTFYSFLVFCCHIWVLVFLFCHFMKRIWKLNLFHMFSNNLHSTGIICLLGAK